LLTVLLLAGSIPTQTPNAKTATPITDSSGAKNETLQIEKSTPPATEPPVTQSVITELTAAQAEDIALQQAGLTRNEVTFSRTEKDIERSRTEWEVEFRYGDWEYDYTIDAETGAILDWDKKYDPRKPAPVTPPVTDPPATEPAAKELTGADAKAIALKHAGLTESQVTRLKVEKDFDDGVWVFEIEFRAGKMEYEYEIHAKTGKILDWDKELDD
jgi:uncharacterized membrane protein YkoI